MSGVNKDNFSKISSENLSLIIEHDIVKGTIISIDKNGVLVDIGREQKGSFGVSELDLNSNLKVGDSIEVYIESRDAQLGRYVLSYNKAVQSNQWNKTWGRVHSALNCKEIINGKIISRAEGGLVLEIFGLEAFIPNQFIDFATRNKVNDIIGENINVFVLKINEDKQEIIASQKPIEGDIIKESADSIYFETPAGLFRETNNGYYLLGIKYSIVGALGETSINQTYKLEWPKLYSSEGLQVGKDFLSYSFRILSDKMLCIIGNSCGISDYNGKIIVPMIYSSIYQASDDCFIVTKRQKDSELRFGAINNKGEEILPVELKFLGRYNGFFVYSNNATIINPPSDSDFDHKLFDNEVQFGVMDCKFNVISLPKYSNILDANDFCIKVSKDDDIGVIDLQGKEILELGECEKVWLLDSGLIKYALNLGNHYECGVINYKGEDVIPCDYSAIEIINSNYLMVCSVDYERLYDDHYDLRYDDMGLWGVIDTEGNVILSCSYPKEFVADALGDKLNLQRRCSSGNQHQIEYGEHFNDSNKLDYKKDYVHSVWDDDTIDEAFEGETELTWNVD